MSEGADERHARWCKHFYAIADDVHFLHIRSEIFEGLDRELVRTRRPGSGNVVEVLRSTYAEAQAVCVRRLVDTRKGTVSLVRLVNEMAQNATVLTRDRYVSNYDRSGTRPLGERDFDGLAGERAVHMPKSRLIALRNQIQTAGQTVKEYVDERIAHTGSAQAAKLKWGELKQAVHDLSEAYTRVGSILTATHHVAEPVVSPEWQVPFMSPLFVQED
jgi:hypothetical protein